MFSLRVVWAAGICMFVRESTKRDAFVSAGNLYAALIFSLCELYGRRVFVCLFANLRSETCLYLLVISIGDRDDKREW